MIFCVCFFPVLLLSLLPTASTAPAPAPFRQEDDLGAGVSDVLLVETIPPTRDESSSQPPLLRFVRSAWQQSMQWHPTEKPRGYRPRGCYKRYDRRHRRWMRRACHYNQAGRNRRRRTTTTTTTTSTTPEPPTVPPKSQTKKRCFKRYHKKYKKYVTRCVYW